MGTWLARWIGWTVSALLIASSPQEFPRPAEAPNPSSRSIETASPAQLCQVNPQDGAALKQILEKRLVEFVQNNYPSQVKVVLRNLQSKEGTLQQGLSETARFLTDFARGPISLQTAWKKKDGRRRCFLVSTLRGIKGFPDAVVSFTTVPGAFHPFVVAELDRDGDGTVDQTSSALRRNDALKEWLQEHLVG